MKLILQKIIYIPKRIFYIKCKLKLWHLTIFMKIQEGGQGVFELGNTAAKSRFKQFWNSRLKKVVKKLAFHHQGVAFF